MSSDAAHAAPGTAIATPPKTICRRDNRRATPPSVAKTFNGAGTSGITRVTPSGTVLDPLPVPTAVPIEGLAWNGSAYLATYTMGSSGDGSTYDIKGIRKSSPGHVVT